MWVACSSICRLAIRSHSCWRAWLAFSISQSLAHSQRRTAPASRRHRSRLIQRCRLRCLQQSGAEAGAGADGFRHFRAKQMGSEARAAAAIRKWEAADVARASDQKEKREKRWRLVQPGLEIAQQAREEKFERLEGNLRQSAWKSLPDA